MCYGIYSTFNWFAHNSDKLDPKIVIAIIGGTITISGYFITKHLDKKQKIEQQIREQKIPIYQEFIKFFFEMLHRKDGEKMTQNELEKFVRDFNEKAIVWLSDDSLKAYITWRDKANKPDGEPMSSMLEFEKLLFSFRKDIGHKNQDIKKGDILSMFINDIDKYIKR